MATKLRLSLGWGVLRGFVDRAVGLLEAEAGGSREVFLEVAGEFGVVLVNN